MRNAKRARLAAVLLGIGMMAGCDSSDNFSGSRSGSGAAGARPGGSAVSTAVVSANQSSISFDFDGPLQSDGLPVPWKAKVIRGKLGVSEPIVAELGGHHCLQVDCLSSHFLVYDDAQPYEARDFPVLRWKWKAEVLPKGGDVRTHGAFYYSSSNRNDKVLQMLVGFEGDKVINYSWDTTAPIGTCVDEWSPAATVKTYVIESGPSHLGAWHEYRVNIFADYQKLYGGMPGKVKGISVQTNSNHTSSESEGLVAGITAWKKLKDVK